MEKIENLKSYIKGLKSAVIAFSGGVDSTFLLKVARSILNDKVTAVTIKSALQQEREIKECIDFCKKYKINHKILDFSPLEIENISKNPKDRCYFCKMEIFKLIKNYAQNTCILEGSNKDDEKDYRPGQRALLELQIKSPLRELGFNKTEIRKYSKEMNLKTFNKPSLACLASRIPYNEPITKEKLLMIEKCEEYLFSKGFSQIRVRYHKNLAKIETTENEFEKVFKYKNLIIQKFKEIGFNYIAIDLEGYRTGSLNEALD